jgi:hypothetical protein
MKTTTKLISTPDTILVRWEGDYLCKMGIIKIYFFLKSGEIVDEKIDYTVYPLKPIKNCEEMQVLGKYIFNQKLAPLLYRFTGRLRGENVVFQASTAVPETNTEYTVFFVDESRGPRATTTKGINLIDVLPVVNS